MLPLTIVNHILMIIDHLMDVKKRNDVFNYSRSKQFSVYFLQNTHFVKENELLIVADGSLNVSLIVITAKPAELRYC